MMFFNISLSNQGLQQVRRSKTHGPAWGGPLSLLTSQRAGWAEPLVNLRLVAQPVGPQAGWAWRAGLRAWVKIKMSFEF